jgi:hypothetical protein
MLAADGGGGGTDWASMNIEQMQALIRNPDTEKYYALLTGWSQSYQLIIDHMSQVLGYRNSLAEVWPPEKNAAAAAYIDRLDELIKNLDETYEAAMVNHDAFASATLSISLAQHDMQKIYDEHQANSQLLSDFNAKQQQKQSSSTPLPSPSPSGDEPPVAPGRQEQLRQQAIKLMSGVSSDLVQSQVRIVRPTPYRPNVGADDTTSPNGGVPYAPPPVPPITPISIGIGGIGSGSAGTSTTPLTGSGPVQPQPASPITAQPGASQPGLVLGGTTPSVITPAATGPGPLPPTLPTGGSSPIPTPSILPPGASPIMPGGGLVPPNGTGVNRGLTPPSEGVIRPGTGLREGIHAMPPGGIIGGTPGAGLGQPGATRPGARRINPVGGVIGEGQPGARGSSVRGVGGYGAEAMLGGGGRGVSPGREASGLTRRGIPASERGSGFGGGGTSTGEHAGAAGGRGPSNTRPWGQAASRRGGRRDQSDSDRWDPDNPWETEEGVTPVVLPPREQRVDPGPAIGLS